MKKHIVFALAALVLAGSTALAAVQEGRREAPGGQRSEQGARRDRDGARRHKHGRRDQRSRQRRERVREHLGITEDQRAAGRDVARQLAPIADETRAKARGIVERARALRDAGDREGAKAVLRDELRPLLQGARERMVPLTRPLVESLTPEQRGKIERLLERRGRSFDEDRAAARLGWRLSRRR